jgi:hypothetical protein
MHAPPLRFVLFAAMLLWTFHARAAAPTAGTWSASPRAEVLHLEMHVQEAHTSLTVPLSSLPGLRMAEGADTRFQLVREAGTLNFEGRFSHGEGAGHFQFEPSDAWREEMAKLGHPDLSAKDQFLMALFEVGPTRLRALAKLGYPRVARELLLQVALFQVTPEFIREIREAGYPQVTLEQLVQLRIHAIDSRYIRSLSPARGTGR